MLLDNKGKAWCRRRIFRNNFSDDMQFVLFLLKKLKDKNSFFSFSRTVVKFSVFFCSFLITSIIFVLAGFKHEIRKNIYDFAGNYRFCKYNKEPIDVGDFTTKFACVRGMRKITPYVEKNVLIQCQGFVEGSLLLGIDNEKLGRYIVEGRVYEKDDEFVVGKKLFDRLRIKKGEDVVVMGLEEGSKFLRYKIVGVYETGVDELDDKVSLCGFSGLQKIKFSSGLNFCNGVNLNFDGDYAELRGVAKEYCGRLSSIENEYVYVKDWLKILEKNASLYVMIIFFTILTNVICVLILQLFENKELLDRLLFMGASLAQVENIFILRNVQIVFRSMVGGSVLAFILGFLQMRYRVLGLDASDYYLNFVPVYFDMKIFSIVFLLMISVVMGVLRVVFKLIKKK